jgi:hypothetical protein
MEKGRLYRYVGGGRGVPLWKSSDPKTLGSDFLTNVGNNSFIFYLEQCFAIPNMHRVIFQDQSGWMEAFPEHFEELEEDHAEPKTET